MFSVFLAHANSHFICVSLTLTLFLRVFYVGVDSATETRSKRFCRHLSLAHTRFPVFSHPESFKLTPFRAKNRKRNSGCDRARRDTLPVNGVPTKQNASPLIYTPTPNRAYVTKTANALEGSSPIHMQRAEQNKRKARSPVLVGASQQTNRPAGLSLVQKCSQIRFPCSLAGILEEGSKGGGKVG